MHQTLPNKRSYEILHSNVIKILSIRNIRVRAISCLVKAQFLSHLNQCSANRFSNYSKYFSTHMSVKHVITKSQLCKIYQCSYYKLLEMAKLTYSFATFWNFCKSFQICFPYITSQDINVMVWLTIFRALKFLIFLVRMELHIYPASILILISFCVYDSVL